MYKNKGRALVEYEGPVYEPRYHEEEENHVDRGGIIGGSWVLGGHGVAFDSYEERRRAAADTAEMRFQKQKEKEKSRSNSNQNPNQNDDRKDSNSDQ